MRLFIVENERKTRTLQALLERGDRVYAWAAAPPAAMNQAARRAGIVFLATDPDREGEMEAWRIGQRLPEGVRTQRLLLGALSPAALGAALQAPLPLDRRQVSAGVVRRVLDRLAGNELRPLFPAGAAIPIRHTLAALRLVVERERERRNFTASSTWTISAELAHRGVLLQAWLAGPALPGSRAVRQLTAAPLWWVERVEASQETQPPPPPFTTAALLAAAWQTMKVTPVHTLAAARELYDAGLITFFHTRGTQVAPQAREAARQAILNLVGARGLPPEPPDQPAAWAGEAIRPADPAYHPAYLERTRDAAGVGEAARALYGLIWRRLVASQMAPARFACSGALIRAGQAAGPLPYVFEARARWRVFEGWQSLLPEAEGSGEPEEGGTRSTFLPPLAAGDRLAFQRLSARERPAQPPARYTPASLITRMDETGFGRPAADAATVEALLDAGFIQQEGPELIPTPEGEAILDRLVAAAPELVDVHVTARLEAQLDSIAAGQAHPAAVLAAFTPGEAEPAGQEIQAATAPGDETDPSIPTLLEETTG